MKTSLERIVLPLAHPETKGGTLGAVSCQRLFGHVGGVEASKFGGERRRKDERVSRIKITWHVAERRRRSPAMSG